MTPITIEELEDKLKQLKNKEIKIYCEGIITTNIKIKNASILKTGDNLIIYNQEKNEEEIKLNIHQIMKIQMNKKQEFIINFDNMQSVRLSISTNPV